MARGEDQRAEEEKVVRGEDQRAEEERVARWEDQRAEVREDGDAAADPNDGGDHHERHSHSSFA